MTNIQKAILLIKKLSRFNKFDHLVVNGNKLYFASWNVDYHNGDIDNYKEKEMSNSEVAKFIPDLEEEYAKDQWEAYVKIKKSNFIKELYTSKNL